MVTGLSASNYENSTLDLKTFTRSLDRLRNESEYLRHQYNTARPYPHLVIDDLFEPELLEQLVADFPQAEDRDWLIWDTKHELKTTSRGINGLSTFSQMFCLWLNSQEVIDTFESIVGKYDLVGDPLFFGAGLHEMYRDGWLEMHADYTRHYVLPLIRRFNVLIYLNQDWDTSWGGELVMQHAKNSNYKASYAPFFNRTIIFPTTDQTFHGVPDFISCPVDRTRKLLSIYYWTPVPMPSWTKAGTPLLWATNGKQKLKRLLGR